ncbi:MAG: hypothetical protein ABIZ81_03075, partial [Opitutaceae bacterium]
VPAVPASAFAPETKAAGVSAAALIPAAGGAKGNLLGSSTPLSTEAAEVVARFTQAVGGETLAHQLSDTTSFPESLASLQIGARAPKFEYLDGARTAAPVQGLTADGNSTQLIVRDWTGLVLVPISTSLSVAHTSAVRLLKVEAHPLSDGRVRIWVRVRNAGRQDLLSEVACSFRVRADAPASSPYFYELPVPSGDYRDVFFVSPEGTLTTYTVLVRQGR